MVKTIDIMDALIQEFHRCVPEAEYHQGGITQGYRSPAFLFLLIYDGGERSGKFTKDTMIDLQCIYFGKTDEDGKQDFTEKMDILDRLKEFLNRYELTVGDRVLKFAYETKDADERLAIFLKFRFKDGVMDPTYEEEQAREKAGKLSINAERVI